MRKFTVFFKNGKSKVVTGTCFGNALQRAGFKRGITDSIDFKVDGDDTKGWIYDHRVKKWKSLRMFV